MAARIAAVLQRIGGRTGIAIGSPGGATLPFAVGEDNDRYVRTDQGWRFVSRHWDQLFDREEHS